MAHPNHYTTRLGAPSEHESLMITSQGVAENHSRCACQRQCRGCLGRLSSRILIGLLVLRGRTYLFGPTQIGCAIGNS